MRWVRYILSGVVLTSVFLVVFVATFIGVWSAIWWGRASAIVDRAERFGLLEASSAAPLTTFEKTFIVAELGSSWEERPFPCRSLASLVQGPFAGRNYENGVISVMVGRKVIESVVGQVRQGEWLQIWIATGCALERRYDDRQMMRAYLARAYFGDGLDGSEAAARALFGKPASELDINESARLTALLRAPSHFRRYADAWRERTDWIIGRVTANAEKIAELE